MCADESRMEAADRAISTGGPMTEASKAGAQQQGRPGARDRPRRGRAGPPRPAGTGLYEPGARLQARGRHHVPGGEGGRPCPAAANRSVRGDGRRPGGIGAHDGGGHGRVLREDERERRPGGVRGIGRGARQGDVTPQVSVSEMLAQVSSGNGERLQEHSAQQISP